MAKSEYSNLLNAIENKFGHKPIEIKLIKCFKFSF